ncbi:exopolysaccharide repressor protein [Mesorhizobium sp. USDA-HM6]|nr:exopolysaccharide repressor protein [Mesorhizobium sp. USDA-HM6]
MPYRTFCLVLWLVLCAVASTVYVASHSIRAVVVTTLDCSLLLQLGYFASVLFLIWRTGYASRACKNGAFRSLQENRMAPDDNEVGNGSSDMPQRVAMGRMLRLR